MNESLRARAVEELKELNQNHQMYWEGDEELFMKTKKYFESCLKIEKVYKRSKLVDKIEDVDLDFDIDF